MYNDILVSIKCLVYNHAPFLRDCLDGFIMQKTNFRFEVIIHDDASTDESADIIREYVKQYPDIIKPIFQQENQYSKGNGAGISQIIANTINSASKYIAYCEGDDYWTDPYKLQKQVDFLEQHPEYVMCSHKYRIFFQDKKLLDSKIVPDVIETSGVSYSLDDLIHGKWLFHPLTIMYRHSAFDLNKFNRYKYNHDVVLFYFLLKNGNGYLLPDVMATYRVHRGGIWSRLKDQNKYTLELKQRLAIYDVEQSEDAFIFLMTTLNRPSSRLWMIRNYSFMYKVFLVVYKHKGVSFLMKTLVRKFILVR
ncbi:glycosyltransferase family 2 protein [Phocaeicola coprophilus]|jgi:glycosyltransferase involved in cell wall biosynthesis|uniref:glycosyltransferase family 2 protein n=1 Tax=Phocaeicola coprophilus TaxID=387090 RepID=UPI0039F5B561